MGGGRASLVAVSLLVFCDVPFEWYPAVLCVGPGVYVGQSLSLALLAGADVPFCGIIVSCEHYALRFIL